MAPTVGGRARHRKPVHSTSINNKVWGALQQFRDVSGGKVTQNVKNVFHGAQIEMGSGLHIPAPVVNVSMPEVRVIVEREGVRERDLPWSEKKKEPSEKEKNAEEMFKEWLEGELKGRKRVAELEKFQKMRKEFLDLEFALKSAQRELEYYQKIRAFIRKEGFKGKALAKGFSYVWPAWVIERIARMTWWMASLGALPRPLFFGKKWDKKAGAVSAGAWKKTFGRGARMEALGASYMNDKEFGYKIAEVQEAIEKACANFDKFKKENKIRD
ncbi:MAG: hypothetical protein V1847_01935 [Candidatus Diapherotrites archaeon]